MEDFSMDDVLTGRLDTIEFVQSAPRKSASPKLNWRRLKSLDQNKRYSITLKTLMSWSAFLKCNSKYSLIEIGA